MAINKNSRIRITRPRFTGGGVSTFQDRPATVTERSGAMLVVVLDGERDELGFFVDEVDELLIES